MTLLKESPGTVVFSWWQANIGCRDENAAAKGLSARLRRADPVRALCEPKVHELAHSLSASKKDAARLVRLVCLLAEIRDNDGFSLSYRLGGEKPVLSRGRFETLIRADDTELVSLLRRAIIMADRRCNIKKFADDLWSWNDHVRTNWCFDYFHASSSEKDMQETV